MLCHYKDILALTDKEPTWFDEHGVPRFCDMHPSNLANIYATEAIFYIIACQSCGARYNVAESLSVHDILRMIETMSEEERASFKSEEVTLKDKLKDIDRFLFYGDPPCWECSAGATMSSDTIRIISYWKRDKQDWVLQDPSTYL